MVNEDILRGKWKQVKGSVTKQWGRITDDDLQEIEGDRQRLAGKIQEYYGLSREEADSQIKDFEREYATAPR
jgi:uncharacterized protein YjbJ (UPF0337 family)